MKIVFTSPDKVKIFFTFKDKVHKMLLSGLVYKYKCGGCNATYYGKNKNPLKVRVSHSHIRKLAVNKWICRNICDYFLDL